jgi:hypothetical protein
VLASSSHEQRSFAKTGCGHTHIETQTDVSAGFRPWAGSTPPSSNGFAHTFPTVQKTPFFWSSFLLNRSPRQAWDKQFRKAEAKCDAAGPPPPPPPPPSPPLPPSPAPPGPGPSRQWTTQDNYNYLAGNRWNPKNASGPFPLLGLVHSVPECQKLCAGLVNCHAYTYDSLDHKCIGRTDGHYTPTVDDSFFSGHDPAATPLLPPGEGSRPVAPVPPFVPGKCGAVKQPCTSDSDCPSECGECRCFNSNGAAGEQTRDVAMPFSRGKRSFATICSGHTSKYHKVHKEGKLNKKECYSAANKTVEVSCPMSYGGLVQQGFCSNDTTSHASCAHPSTKLFTLLLSKRSESDWLTVASLKTDCCLHCMYSSQRLLGAPVW